MKKIVMIVAGVLILVGGANGTLFSQTRSLTRIHRPQDAAAGKNAKKQEHKLEHEVGADLVVKRGPRR